MKPVVIARLTAIKADGTRLIAEVQEGASFLKFFVWFTQTGRRYSTKKQYRVSNRNDGLPYIGAHRCQPGLEALKTHLESLTMVKFTSIKIRILRKREYKRLCNASVDEIGGGAVIRNANLMTSSPVLRMPVRKAIPVGKWLQSLRVPS